MTIENENTMKTNLATEKDAEILDCMEWECEMTENMRGEIVPKGAYQRPGTLKDVLRPYFLDTDTHRVDTKLRGAWTGKISVEDRIRRNELTTETMNIALDPVYLDRYYVLASNNAPSRCIDGRCVSCYKENADTSEARELGPQNPGGTVAAALCARVAAWGSMYTEKFSLVEDVHYLNKVFEKIGFTVGGHIDDHTEGNMTGCGAIDKVPEILERITDPSAQLQVRKLAKLMLADYYDQETVDSLLGRLLSLEGMADEYFVRDNDGDYLFRKDTIQTLRDLNPKGVEKLTGAHKEIALIINLVQGTTFHRDQYAVDNEDNDIQVFNYDFWKSIELSEKLYPIDTDDEMQNKLNASLRVRYITVRALFAIGTAMILTDGSVELVVRQTQEAK